jgi:antitoxin component HigA of HigAB toxin-antitoxin module
VSYENVTRKKTEGGEKMLKFKGYCAANGIKQSEVADVLGINITNVNEKLNGKQPFTLEQVKKLCEKYQISADEYFI